MILMNNFKIKNKRGLELAISTIILLLLGILVLIGLITILIMGWDNFKMNIGIILGSDISQMQKQCKLQCELNNNYDYCCEIKKIDNNEYTCDNLIDDCEIECNDICDSIPPIPD